MLEALFNPNCSPRRSQRARRKFFCPESFRVRPGLSANLIVKTVPACRNTPLDYGAAYSFFSLRPSRPLR